MKRFVLAAALTAGLALAQGPGGRGFHPMAAGGGPRAASADQVKAYLALTDAQVTQLQQIQQDEFTANRSIRQQIGEKEDALKTALAGTSPTATELGNLLVDIKNLRAQISQNRDKYRTQALALLNDAQKPKLAALQAAAALQPTIRQATMLNLIAPPAGDSAEPFGGGPGPMPMMAPGGERR